jgi:hypothetical protein
MSEVQTEVQVYKLITGEEVISRIGGETTTTTTLVKPRVVAIGPGPGGQMSITLIPLLASNPDGDLELEKSAIIGRPTGNIEKALEAGYLEQTTGLALV